MSNERPDNINEAVWEQQQEILKQLKATNRHLSRLTRRSIFWPVCFAIILSPFVAAGIGLALLVLFTSATVDTAVDAVEAAKESAEQHLREQAGQPSPGSGHTPVQDTSPSIEFDTELPNPWKVPESD